MSKSKRKTAQRRSSRPLSGFQLKAANLFRQVLQTLPYEAAEQLSHMVHYLIIGAGTVEVERLRRAKAVGR